MKVFTVTKEESSLKLTVYPSQNEFLLNNSWIDSKFIKVCTTSELKNYDEEYVHRMVVHSPEEIEAHNLLHLEYIKIYG